MITGSCLCGQLSYELDETKTEAALHCHCKDCQKVTGSGKATIVMLPRDSVKLSGEHKLYKSRGTDGSHVGRGFCPICGSQMLTFVEEIPDHVFVKAGTMDDSSWVKPEANCWHESESTWSPVNTAVMSFDRNPPA